MRITSLSRAPIYSIPCVGVGPGGRDHVHRDVSVLSATVDALPEGLDALLVCADLQFVDTDLVPSNQRTLLGESVARELGLMAGLGMLPDASATGVLLAGDFYVDPSLSKRGGFGEVLGVWRAFEESFAWVAGVAGNHDAFHGAARRPTSLRRNTARFLHGDVAVMGGVRVGGVSGIIAEDTRKPWRRTERSYVDALTRVLEQEPDVILLHESPRPLDPSHPGRGNPTLSDTITRRASARRPPLVISGHVGWEDPLDPTGDGPQLLNVEERVVYLTREPLAAL